MTDPHAYILRENTGTTGIEITARAAVEALANFGVPHLIVGGFAVQELGYPRVTIDVDLVVPDVLDALEYLTADFSRPFRRVPHLESRVQDQRNGVMVDILPAGQVLKAGCKVPFPQPFEVFHTPTVVTIEQLISLKIDSWSNSPTIRIRDKADVVELISRRNLSRSLSLHPAVQHLYTEIWDALQAEGPISHPV